MAPQSTGATSTAPGASATGTAAGSGTGTAAAQTDTIDATSAQNEQTRQDLELKLQELIECLLELSITVYDFQAESNLLVHQKIQELIAQLSEIESFKDKLDMMVPWEVLSFEAALTQNLGSVFPEEMNDYDQILKEAKTPTNTMASGTASGTQSKEAIAAHQQQQQQQEGGNTGAVNNSVALSSLSGSSSVSPSS
ncbi:hypothetical protein BGZ65_002537 [Modicella reniformis]|uniref:Mediator of RNA polymerase II transcription subunit 10 n=1 Tax=Modicella reniformis TaxID=1440133 RepID=A0A9P6MIY9_9FUNG|nr:hypothetical protein BGZ65_002537 [Modicella reniformis]